MRDSVLNEGTDNDPCDILYHGPFVFSENEARSVARFLTALNGTVQAFLTVHSYGGYWFYPYGYGGEPDDVDEQVPVPFAYLTPTRNRPMSPCDIILFDARK